MFTENVSRLRRLVEGARHAEKPLVFHSRIRAQRYKCR